jgi:hypothetical protein
MKRYSRRRGTTSLIPTSALGGGEWSASHPNYFTPSKVPQYWLKKKLGGLQSQSAYDGEENNLVPFRSQTPDNPAQSLVTIQSELSQHAGAVAIMEFKPSKG